MAAITASLIAAPAVAGKVQPKAGFSGLTNRALPMRAAKPQLAVSNGTKVRQMLVWDPKDNKYFETLSFLPPLTADQIAKQVDYIVDKGWTPCLEFAEADSAYVKNVNNSRFGPVSSGYYDNRYWTMYKLPMFGCTDPGQVLGEIESCTKSFPDAYIRLVAFDNVKQVQSISFLVHRPSSATDYKEVSARSK